MSDKICREMEQKIEEMEQKILRLKQGIGLFTGLSG